jgi:hypothetical protein
MTWAVRDSSCGTESEVIVVMLAVFGLRSFAAKGARQDDNVVATVMR